MVSRSRRLVSAPGARSMVIALLTFFGTKASLAHRSSVMVLRTPYLLSGSTVRKGSSYRRLIG